MQWLKKNLSLLIILVITIIYLLLIFSITDLPSFKKLELNAMGDFIAGSFAPLAFIWLVFGYLQQGEELKQNTEALKLQAEELKNSVEQQRQLVEVTQAELQLIKSKDDRQIKLETIQAQPFFHFLNHKIYLQTHTNNSENLPITHIILQFTNSRAICRKLEIAHVFPTQNYATNITEIDLIKNNDVICATDAVLNPEFNTSLIDIDIDLKFSYLDLYDQQQFQIIRFSLMKKIESEDTIFWKNTYIRVVSESYNH